MESIKIIYLCLIHGSCCITDGRWQKIKNWQVLAVLTGALVFKILCGDGQAVKASLWTMGLFFAVLFPLYCIRTIGAGDVKLLCVTAFYIGADDLKVFLTGALISGAVLALGKLMYYKTFLKRMQYFFTYVKNVLATGSITVYGIPNRQEEVLKLTLPVYMGVICWGLYRICCRM